MRKLQPELKRIKAAAKGNKQKRIHDADGTLQGAWHQPVWLDWACSLSQIPILIGLYSGLRRIVTNPKAIVTFAYPALQHLPWLRTIAGNIHRFDSTLFGVVDLTRAALNKGGGVYWPAMLIVIGSAVIQYYQSKTTPANHQRQPQAARHSSKTLAAANRADQSEMNAAIGRSTRYFCRS